MSYVSTEDSNFSLAIEGWLVERSEVSALIRYSASAGAKSFEFFYSLDDFLQRLRELPARACVTAFREPQLSLRGFVDEKFIASAIAQIPDGTEFLIAGLQKVTYGKASWFKFLSGENLCELEEELRSCLGEMVAVGVYPPWLVDSDEVKSAVVPGMDGSVAPGVY